MKTYNVKHRIILFSLALLLPVFSIAQGSFYQSDSSVKVFAYGREMTMAGCGGFNAPEFAMADLNNDGLQDLVVFERGIKLVTFLNKGTEGNPDYRYAPEYALNFPPLLDYLILADYNCDGIADVFTGGSGFEVFKGYYNPANQLCFSYYKKLRFENEPAHPHSNAFNNPGDMPAVVDVDGDGDLDFIAYEIDGNFMRYYRNMRVEHGLPCDSIEVYLRDRCWGRVYQGYERAHSLARTCDESGLLRPANKVTHQGNGICVFDWDMDGDMDYLDGNVSFNELTFLKNGRIETGSSIDTMITQDTLWQSGGKRVDINIWPIAYNVDIDQDGKKDLLISPNTAEGTENYKCIWFYKNLTTPGSPNWQYQSDSFFTDRTVDLGSGSYPLLYDYDKDGKKDLIVGSDGYMQPNGRLKSRMSFYKNTSTVGHPAFTLQTADFLSLGAADVKGAAPATGDIDNDGKDDLIIGHSDGTLSYYKNMAASNNVQPDWQLTQLQMTDMAGTEINLDGNAAPFLYDVNKDGKKDLLIGSVYGYIRYYENVSSIAGTIKLKLVNTKLGMAMADPSRPFGGNSVPYVGKLDSSGNEYLFIGSNSGRIYQYAGIQSGDVSAAYTLVDSQYSFIDTLFPRYNRSSMPDAAYDNLRSSLTVGNIDGGDFYAMIVGNIRGGLEFYRRKVYIAAVPQLYENARVLVYPNPARNTLNISWADVLQPAIQISVVNMAGQQLLSQTIDASTGHAALPVDALANGVYTIILQSGDNKYYNKFTVIR